jgi:exodeoxyribonuclease V alpha subunit
VAGVFNGTVGVVTALSTDEQSLTVRTDEDELVDLLYAAVTRAKKLVVLVGSRRALAAAVRTVGAGRRHTALTYRLRS